MPITTKTGDKGRTSLLHGVRVAKDNLRIEIGGILDELSSFLGLAKSLLKDKALKKLIDRVQKELFMAGSEIAAKTASVQKLRRRISQGNVKGLESFIEKLEEKRKHKKHTFVLPGGNSVSATLDVARAIARRAERRIVTLRNKGKMKNRHILIYLNKLSDLLYLMARKVARNK